MNIIMPRLKYGCNPCAIYKFTFDTGHFYIGSSEHLKTRFATWRTNLRRMKGIKNQVIADILPNVNEVEFEIIQEVPIGERLIKETEYISLYKSNPLLLNRQLDAITGGVRPPLPPHLEKPHEDYVWAFAKPVYQFDRSGNFIKKHNSTEAAARDIGVDASTIIKHLKATISYRGVKGFIFRRENDFGTIAKTKIVKQRCMIHFIGKPVIDLNTGVFYYSAKELALLIGVKPDYLQDRLSGAIKNTTPYRYA